LNARDRQSITGRKNTSDAPRAQSQAGIRRGEAVLRELVMQHAGGQPMQEGVPLNDDSSAR